MNTKLTIKNLSGEILQSCIFHEQKTLDAFIALIRESEEYLKSTDWKILRHKDQKELNIDTSLTEEEYQELLMLRQESREKIIR